jgi:hypothetical protein
MTQQSDYSHIETFEINWNGIIVQISWEETWLNLIVDGQAVSHLQIESIHPPRSPLPMTETGYRSLFTSPEMVQSFGGPVAFVLSWLNDAAKSPSWREQHQASKQLTFF